MSTGLNCIYVEIKPGAWYYVLEGDFGNRFDWMADASVVGPFKTMEEANKHLHENNANPGGYWQVSNGNITDRERKMYDELSKRAKNPLVGSGLAAWERMMKSIELGSN